MGNLFLGIILAGTALAALAVFGYSRDKRGIRRMTTPCPYCSNPDRDFWISDPSNNTGACKYKVSEHGGSDPPCVTDNYGTYRKY